MHFTLNILFNISYKITNNW